MGSRTLIWVKVRRIVPHWKVRKSRKMIDTQRELMTPVARKWTEMNYSTFGRHVAVDLWGIPCHILNDCEQLKKYLLRSAEECGATVLSSHIHRFEPQGVSVFVLLSESHISIHTYPEKGYAALDCYTCGETIDPSKAVQYLVDQLSPTRVHTKLLLRGMGRIEVKE